ncbi:ATP-dependent DNA helicase DDX11 isoform X2 [Anopheles moucheti]|uniref:ATP-dependent DNA helicase DDX11 isoform X2 n=1 Tax=Anopheles moucheti TaxID=186751 RepID=UPI0022F13CF0|nr:ATP-dependent DNA helicase DDX11 isoform X2 [Anopheles moucheti]
MAFFKPKKQLYPPDDGSGFAFPFLPYDIQLDFMQTLFTVLHAGGIGIFESPTGTGKSLSLTCGTLTWLKDYERLVGEELRETIERLRNEITQLEKENESSSDWISGQYNAMGQRKQMDALNLFKQSIAEYDKRLVQMKDKGVLHKMRWEKLRAKDGTLKEESLQQDVTIDEDEFLIPDESDDDSDEDRDASRQKEDEEENRYRPVQVIFCSRTHSQLSQVVNEVKETEHAKNLRLISLASRQNLCINAEVRKLKTSTLMNERCLELLKTGGRNKTNSSDDDGHGVKKRRKLAQSCPYYNQRAIEGLKNGILHEVPDIEDLVKEGKRENACPYYASRAAIPDSQMLMVPYQLILHRRTRQQSGIDMRNSILIIDEAHNLLDTIAAIHSQELKQEQLRQAKMYLSAYKARYFSRFSTKNLLRINQLIFIATRLDKVISPVGKISTARPSRMIDAQELLLEADIFNLNLTDILSFCERSRIAQKVHGFAQSSPRELLEQDVSPFRGKVGSTSQGSTSALKSLIKNLEEDNKSNAHTKKAGRSATKQSKAEPVAVVDQENDHQIQTKPLITNAIRPLINFLHCMMEDGSGDSRVLLSYDDKDPSQAAMKYLLLNPGARFDEIVQSCRSVVLAGGTMQPTDELTEQVFRHCRERVTIKSYPHVVPKDAVLPIAISHGPTGKEFMFNFANKQNIEMLDELQSTLLNVCQVVPNGVVVFFSSYDFLDLFYRKLEESGNRTRLEERKKVFREPKTSGQVERILADYGRAARSATGAILFSVVGGKLSEGLNFSDELGRCVVVVGLPYPNRTSPELIERMRYLDRSLPSSGGVGSSAGNEYYENLCMKAVNQCIGRAARHIRDYAAVILLDTRYCMGDRIRRKLPGWIVERMNCADRYGQAHGKLVKFFRQHKAKLLG